MEAEIRVLGRYVPSLYQSEIIEVEIKQFLPACCQRERIGVRTPMGIIPPEANLQWHQDGGPGGTVRHMVVWASEDPTELKNSSGEIVVIQPHDVVWLNNDLAFHRQPTGTNERTRWFLAVRCSGA